MGAMMKRAGHLKWFVVLYCGSVATFAAITYGIRLLLRLL